jgi:uncharacterized protein YifE (UPF0438 family)
MASRGWPGVLEVILVLTHAVAGASLAWAASPEEIEQKLKVLQEQVNELKKQLEQNKTQAPPPPTAVQPAAPATTVPPAPPSLARPSWLSDFKLGGYGSTRFEANDLNKFSDSFTFRRFVLTGDATIGERLRSVVEIEFERLTELEVERRQPVEGGLRGFSQSIEGSDTSEISLEQAWMQFALADWARFRAGMLLVPLGRFNINHDDNRWDLPRRSLVDRGVSVLPVKSAWSEVGMGFQGDIPTQRFGKFSYQVYVMNGVTLDSTLETVARASGELETEVEIQPRRGTANLDFKRDKAGALRLAWSPTLESEIAASVYYGRYTPDFLPSEALWGVGVDGKATFGPFEVEGEYIVTRYNGITRVARGFANAVLERALESGTAPLNTTVDFELAGVASTKHGYWLDLRYRFFPDVLRDSIFGWKFDNPQFIVTTRMEQVWLEGLVQQADFTGGELTQLSQENRFVDRATLGLAYRPVPLVVFQLAFERTWTNKNKSLAAVTNFLPAQRSEDTANAFLFGVAFGF